MRICSINTKTLWILLIVLKGIFGLTSGPTLPEYSEFEPVDMTDLVNLATGDFVYSVPLLTVPGPNMNFPVTASYHSGPMMQKEASWVGLGWNVGVGAITRLVSGDPDDFKGVKIAEIINSDKIYGWYETNGYGLIEIGKSWQNNLGKGGMWALSFNMSLSEGADPKSGGNKGIGVNFSIRHGWNGLFRGTNVSAYGDIGKFGGGFDVGTNGVTIHGAVGPLYGNIGSSGVGLGVGKPGLGTVGVHLGQGGVGMSISGYGVRITANKDGVGMSISVMGVSIAANKDGVSMSSPFVSSHQTTVSGNQYSTNKSSGFMFLGYGKVKGQYSTWLHGQDMKIAYGYLYSDQKNMECKELQGKISCIEAGGGILKRQDFIPFSAPFDGKDKELSHAKNAITSQDIYQVIGEGVAGVFQPYRKEDGDYTETLGKVRQKYYANCKSAWNFFGFDCSRHYDFYRYNILDSNRNLLGKKNADNDVY